MHAGTLPLPTGTPACMPPRLDAGANFETLRDGCTALILRPGQRLKIDLADLYNGGMAARKRRLLAKLDSDADGGGAAVATDFNAAGDGLGFLGLGGGGGGGGGGGSLGFGDFAKSTAA